MPAAAVPAFEVSTDPAVLAPASTSGVASVAGGAGVPLADCVMAWAASFFLDRIRSGRLRRMVTWLVSNEIQGDGTARLNRKIFQFTSLLSLVGLEIQCAIHTLTTNAGHCE